MKFKEYIGSQFGNPRGIVGKICCLVMNIINKAMYHKIISLVDNKSAHVILDIGFGNGYMVKKLAANKNNIIYGIDISEDMLANATKKNRRAVKAGRVILSQGDCCKLAFADQIFDVISTVNTIYFWPDTLTGLQEIYRVLQENGVFYNVVYSKEWLQKLSYTKKGFKFFEKTDYIELGKKAGFSNVVVEEIVRGKSYIITYIK